MSRRLAPFAALLLALAAAPLGLAHEPVGTPKLHCEATAADRAVHDYGPSVPGVLALRGDYALDDCDGDASFWQDGHLDFAFGGAELVASPWGAQWCLGLVVDHAQHPTVTVVDESGEAIPFLVGVERSYEFDFCGDGLDDAYQECLGSCTVAFEAGMDGAYRVYLLGGTRGHIVATPAG